MKRTSLVFPGLATIALFAVGCAGSDSRPTSDGGSDTPADAARPSMTHVVINFDELTSDTPVTNQYATHALFTTDSVPATADAAVEVGQSEPNFLIAGSAFDTMHPLYVDFTTPVSNLRFNALAIEDTGTIATVRVLSGTNLLGTVDVQGKGTDRTPVPVDVSAYDGVTRIEVVDITDLYGIDYDDFAFDAAQ